MLKINKINYIFEKTILNLTILNRSTLFNLIKLNLNMKNKTNLTYSMTKYLINNDVTINCHIK
jgi:hypothetical protein